MWEILGSKNVYHMDNVSKIGRMLRVLTGASQWLANWNKYVINWNSYFVEIFLMFQAKKITRPFWLPENYEHVIRELKHTHNDKFCDVFYFAIL